MKNVEGNLSCDRPRTSSKRDLGILLDASKKMGVAVLRRTRILSQESMWLVIRLVALLYANCWGNCCYGLIDLIQRESRNKLKLVVIY